MDELAFVTHKKNDGWPEPDAKAEWKRLVARAEVADYLGYKGAPRYWIEQDVVRTREKEMFIDIGVDQTSERFKNVNDGQLNALRGFAMNNSEDTTHEFFQGEATPIG